MISIGDNLPNPSRVLRYVGFSRMEKDEDDNIVGPAVTAFERQPGHDYLSVTWCEYFQGSQEEQIRCAIEAIRNSLRVRPKACFCLANTAELKAVAEEFGIRTREVFLPEDDNPAHAGVYGIAADNRRLLERLAECIWAEYFTKERADVLPLTECIKALSLSTNNFTC